jgi:para-aminobenzoate synthetase component 1
MEIIDELEPARRHLYTGAIGYISFHDSMDLSIAIRTATVVNDKIVFSVGGGIVYDSDPADEFEETLHKGKTLMAVFGDDRSADPERPLLWQNGRLVPAAAAAIPLADEGLQYGNGIFETIRTDRASPLLLKAHTARFETAWRRFFPGDPPDLGWSDVIGQVVRSNRLEKTTAAVKIIATRGTRDRAPYDFNLIVTARPYTHRLAETGAAGLRLLTYPHPRQSPLADFKTLNYLFYLEAGRWARRRGADEALILNPDGTVSETNSANLLLLMENQVVRPVSVHVLPGVMERAACDALAARGYDIGSEVLMPGNLQQADAVILTSSLIGAVPVIEVDGVPLKPATALCDEINQDTGCTDRIAG